MGDIKLPEPLGEIVGIRASLHGVEFYGYFSDGLHQTEKLRVHTADQMHSHAAAQSAADNAGLRERVTVLEDALREAADDIEEWGSYASDYFIKKWDLAGDVAKARATVEAK